MEAWFWFWIVCFAVAGGAFVVILVIVGVRGVGDLRRTLTSIEKDNR